MMFPARAGMNRAFNASSILGADVPRTCGDEPSENGNPISHKPCSPHVRG